jgi:transcriptional regulator with XRE-family HTH domain
LNLGVNIRRARRASGLSQIEFAKKLRVSQGAISNWERGRDRPSAATLFLLADVTGDQSFVAREMFTEEVELLPQAPHTHESRLFDGIRNILSRIEALEQQVAILTRKKKAGTR